MTQTQAALSRIGYLVTTNAERLPSGAARLFDETNTLVKQALSAAPAAPGDTDADLDLVHAIATEYLPTALSAYLRLPAEYAVTERNAHGRTAAEELELELRLIRGKLAELTRAQHARDAQRLQQQTAYLSDKFGVSELDLG